MDTNRTARRMALAAAIAVALSPAAQAATFTVVNDADSGAGSLRAAIEAANAAPGADDIVFDATFFDGSVPRTVLLATPLSITDALQVAGPGSDVLALDGQDDHRVLEIDPSLPGSAVTLDALTFRNGFSDIGDGGCILARSTALVIEDSVVTGCDAGTAAGGGLAISDGEGLPPKGTILTTSLVVRESRFFENRAGGAGAIAANFDGGSLLFDGVVLEDNQGEDYAGGAELLMSGPIVLQDSVISGNVAGGPGGGLITYGYGNVEIRDTQFSDNRVLTQSSYGTYDYGGGAMVLSGGNVLVTGATFTNNVISLGKGVGKGEPAPSAGGVGGGLFTLPASEDRSLRIDTTQFVGNVAQIGGGASVGLPQFATRTPRSKALQRYAQGKRAKALNGDNEIVETRFAQNLGAGGASAFALLGSAQGGPQNKRVSPGMTLERVTMIGNEVDPGAFLPMAMVVFGTAWPVQLVNCTITGNSGGIVTGFPIAPQPGEPSLILDHTTVTDNPAGGVVSTPFGPPVRPQPPILSRYFTANKDYPLPTVAVAIRNSVVTGANEGNDLVAQPAMLTLLHAVIGTSTPADVSVADAGGSQFGVDPLLGAPELAGHPFLEVQVPQEGSPLIDAGDPDVADFDPPAIDERGAPRLSGAAIDVGAVETQLLPGTVSFDPATLVVAETAGTATFTAVRSGGDDGAISVQFATSDVTATAGQDYSAATGQLDWADGESGAKTFAVAITDDALVEADETFVATLSEATGGATLGTDTATATITSEDVAPVGTLALAVASITVDETAGTATLAVTRSGGSNGAVSVDYATANGSATAGSDYTAASGTLNWADGDATAKNIVVPILDDALVESPETFTLALSNASGGATLGAGNATVTITSDDVPPSGTLAIAPSALTVNEDAGTASLTVSRSGGSFGAVSVNYASANGTATAGSDYTASSGTLNWADGDTAAKTIAVPIIDDTLVEANEQFSVMLSQAGGGASLGANASTVTIVSNDAAPTGSLQFDGAGNNGMVTLRFNEDGTPATQAKAAVQIAVTRSGGSAGPASIDYATQDGTAMAPGDYVATTGKLSWADGETGTKFITVMLMEDGLAENEENFRIVLSNAQGAGLGINAQAQVVIVANGAAFGAAPITVPAGDARGWLTLLGAMLLAGWAGLRRRS